MTGFETSEVCDVAATGLGAAAARAMFPNCLYTQNMGNALFVEHLNPYPNVNSSQPKRVALTARGPFILKVPVQEQKTNRILVNETIGAILSKRVGLDALPIAVLKVTEATRQSPDPVAPGLYFGSEHWGSWRTPKRGSRFSELLATVSSERLQILHALDTLLRNPDRKATDILLAPDSRSVPRAFIPIDFSGAFGSACWEANDLEEKGRIESIAGHVEEAIYCKHGGAVQKSPSALAAVGSLLPTIADAILELRERISALRLANDEYAAISTFLRLRLRDLDNLIERDIEQTRA